MEATEERKRRAKRNTKKRNGKKDHGSITSGASAGVGTSSFGYDSYQNNHQPTYQPTPVVETTHSAGSNTTSSSTHSLLSKPRGGGLQLGGKKTTAGRTLPSGNGAHEPLLATNQPVFAHKAAVESSQTSVAAGSSGVKSGSVSRTGSPAPSNAAATCTK